VAEVSAPAANGAAISADVAPTPAVPASVEVAPSVASDTVAATLQENGATAEHPNHMAALSLTPGVVEPVMPDLLPPAVEAVDAPAAEPVSTESSADGEAESLPAADYWSNEFWSTFGRVTAPSAPPGDAGVGDKSSAPSPLAPLAPLNGAETIVASATEATPAAAEPLPAPPARAMPERPAALDATAPPLAGVAPAWEGVDEAADQLRWRAEMLMDEMLVGAVDASAGERERTTYSAFDLPAHELAAYRATAEAVADVRPTWHTNGAGGPQAESPFVPQESSGRGEAAPGTSPAPVAGAAAGGGSGYASVNGQPAPKMAPVAASGAAPASIDGSADTLSPRYTSGSAEVWPPAAMPSLPPAVPSADPFAAAAPSAESTAAAPRRPSAPRMPTRLVAPTGDATLEAGQPAVSMTAAATAQPAVAPLPTRTPDAASSSTRATQPRTAATEQSPPSQRVTPVEQRYPRAPRPIDGATAGDASTQPGLHSENAHLEAGAPFDPAGYEPGLGPIRRSTAVVNGQSITGAMSVAMANRNTKFATLLPRNSPWDVHELEREFIALSDEMARVLPSGHESSRRARHLLEKAQTIFATDPLRTAEVDYYMAQVRSILQRSRQTMQWAGLYRQKVVLYLGAWATLSFVIVAASFYYGPALAAWLGGIVGWAQDGFLDRHVVALLFTAFAGALGGAIGGIATINRFHRRQLGFMDRKYSLRGLILPPMGLLVGALLYTGAGLVAWMVGGSVAASAWAVLGLATVAFVIGFAQEMVYGTRE
jgi:hypothetical protein